VFGLPICLLQSSDLRKVLSSVKKRKTAENLFLLKSPHVHEPPTGFQSAMNQKNDWAGNERSQERQTLILSTGRNHLAAQGWHPSAKKRKTVENLFLFKSPHVHEPPTGFQSAMNQSNDWAGNERSQERQTLVLSTGQNNLPSPGRHPDAKKEKPLKIFFCSNRRTLANRNIVYLPEPSDCSRAAPRRKKKKNS
jgi:hypothetical protein